MFINVKRRRICSTRILRMFSDARGSCERIRLGSLAPELINHDFVESVKNTNILAPHFHLSLQSGSDNVLRNMKRRYNRTQVMRVIEDIKENIPRATFTTDLMVGFPGESDEDFLQTVDFVRRARFLDAHVFAYSRREGTPAACYDGQISESVKRERSDVLIRIKNKVRDGVLEEIVKVGEPLSAIAETLDSDGCYTAHSDTYVEIKFLSENKNLTGEIVKLLPVSHKNGKVVCKFAENI